ncbi:uncharacterized protein LOC132715026 [Ruditapes philippinarum]|uniref:uncharacterized protein LOC132715026 n=1 Tax=Ruditapes philippinarum TaxID=129788 RepID=UPI00295B8186|nr:uncharacterized protein LOC132715026 [Ruditapes philippinarum]
MATSLRKWTIPSVYIWIYMVIFLDCMVCNGDLFSYTNSTQSVLCEAQCEALCQDKVSNCIPKCAGQRHWMADCDRPNCTSTCSVLYAYHYQNRGELVHVPHVSLNRTGPLTIELAWNVPTHISPNPASNVSTIIYIVEETHPDPRLQGVHSVSIKQWTRGTTVKLDLKDMCNTDSYRVMAINQIGSMGFSTPVQIPAMPAPGLVSNISFVGNGVYYYVNKDNKDQSMFMAILQWDPPVGWQDSEILRYRWNPMVKRYCDDMSQDSLPLFTIMKNRSRHILIKMASNSINCVFTTQVQAVSKCNKNGPWTDFVVDLRNCSAITGYKCHQDGQDGSDPPGPVQNVTLNVTSSPVLVLMQMNPNPFIINQYTNSPLLINLHVKWKPPFDMGTSGIIDHYTIRSGVAKTNQYLVPPSFIGTPHEIKVSKDIHDLSFPIPTQNIPYTFGIQVRAVGPYQEVPENDWGVLRMRTIDVRRSDSAIGPFMKEGKVLLDEAGIVILHVNNSLPVQFLPSPPMGNDTNIDRYAVQWGPMDGPDSMTVENTTIIPLNQTSLTVNLLNDDVKKYGVKVIYLREEDDEPGLEDWENTTLWTFTNPFADNMVENIVLGDQLTPLYVMIGVVVSMILTSVAVKYLLRRHHFKHLEERLMSSDDDIGEDGDHYFVMRLPDHDAGDDTDIPTVVADHWELPHCCLKMGRILGSGAFGQVVKGRVSKSLLMHRGIDSHTTHNGIGTHVIVAVKMLQDRADETHIQNFLKEIDMMKDIGYHRNIVSILGCCTLRQPYCLVVEHMPHGDLLAYFRNIRNKMEQKETEGDGYINQDIDMFSPRDLLSVARQITAGMDFLSQKGFVHRDLAARNILVGNDKTVKIGDFGLARYIYNDVNKIYVTRRGGKLPLRWMSPEAIFDMTFSTASDIHARLLIIDEISMVGNKMFSFIHQRLQQIMGSNKLFGGLSILAVGDMFQLKPVFDGWIFENLSNDYGPLATNLWNEHFKMFELQEIMRQKDCKQFAEVLNRLRESNHTKADVTFLLQRKISTDLMHPQYPLTVPHIYIRNADVDSHNQIVCQVQGSKCLKIEALDVVLGDVSSEIKSRILNSTPSDISKTMGLAKQLNTAIGLRNELSCNIQVEDGMSNGAAFKLEGVGPCDKKGNFQYLWAHFESDDIGKQCRQQNRNLYKSNINKVWTPIFTVKRQLYDFLSQHVL